MIRYLISAFDNDMYFFYGRSDIRRCLKCGHLLDKWNEDISAVNIKKMSHDISYSYDGVLVVSRKFKSTYEDNNLTGLQIVPLGHGYYSIYPMDEIQYDIEKRKTRFVNKCSCCGQYESVVGATPVFLKAYSEIPEMGFVRTDIEFGTLDEKHPLCICGQKAGEILLASKLKGIDVTVIG